MGGRVSVPRGADGISEATALSTAQVRKNSLARSRRIGSVITVVLLGGVFFVYTRITVAAAKENVRRSRQADGGTINWRNESRRNHGSLNRPEERTLVQQLFVSREERDRIAAEEEERKREAENSLKRPRDMNVIEEGIWKAREERERARRERAERDKPE